MTKPIKLVAKTFKASPEDLKLIRDLEKKNGLGYSQIARLAIRSLAKEQGIKQ